MSVSIKAQARARLRTSFESFQDVSMFPYNLESRIMNQRRMNAHDSKNQEEGQAVLSPFYLQLCRRDQMVRKVRKFPAVF